MADRIGVAFKAQTKHGELSTALWFESEAVYLLAKPNLDTMKAERVTMYEDQKDFEIANPAPPPTKAQLIAAKAELEAQIAILDEEIGKK